jgi:uncharacterized membrane protein
VLYALPTVPFGSGDVVVIESAETTVILSALVAVWTGVEESVALTVKLVVAVAFGVPVIAPVLGVRIAHVGSEPEEMLQVTGGLPPALTKVVL